VASRNIDSGSLEKGKQDRRLFEVATVAHHSKEKGRYRALDRTRARSSSMGIQKNIFGSERAEKEGAGKGKSAISVDRRSQNKESRIQGWPMAGETKKKTSSEGTKRRGLTKDTSSWAEGKERCSRARGCRTRELVTEKRWEENLRTDLSDNSGLRQKVVYSTKRRVKNNWERVLKHFIGHDNDRSAVWRGTNSPRMGSDRGDR